MKKLLPILALIASCDYCFSQIAVREVAEKAIPKPRMYDSLSAFNHREDFRIYIGQELFFLPVSTKYENLRPSDTKGYSDFSNLPRDAGNLKEYQYHPVKGDHQYDFKSDYNLIAGKYFIVDDFIDKSDDRKFKYGELGYYFKLINKELRDTAYYQLAKVKAHLSSNVSFLLVSHFEYLKTSNVGKRFQAQKRIPDILDVNSGLTVVCEKDSWWECTDLTLVETKENYRVEPVFIFKNAKGEEIAVEPKEFKSSLLAKREFFLSEEELATKKKLEELQEKELAELKKRELEERQAEQIRQKVAADKFRQDCIAKYGSKFGNYIAEGKVVLGMTKEMCRLAWGAPHDINRTTTTHGVSEQWVYSLKHYLYFEGDVLTAIQN